MNRFFTFLLIVTFVFVGCNKKQQQQPGGGAPPVPAPNIPTLGVPMPTAEILSALGPENNVSIQRLLPNPILVAAGKPKQFLTSPVCTGGERLAHDIVAQSLQLYYIDPNNIEQFVQSSGFPLMVPISIPNPQDPNAPPQQRIVSIRRRATTVTFDTSVDKSVLLTSAVGMGGDVDPAVFESLKRTEGKNEYYDLTPPNIIIPQRLAIGLVDERTVVIAEGTEDDIRSVFSDTVPRSAVLERLKHMPVDSNELTIITSLEGLNISPELLEKLLEQIEQAGHIPHNLVSVINQHLRAVSLSLNVSVASGQPIISIQAEGRNEESAKEIGDTINGLIVMGKTMMSAMSEEAKKDFPIPPDFAVSMLNAMSVEVKGTQVNVVLNNFETLIPTIAEGIRNRQMVMEYDQLKQRRIVKLETLAGRWAAYYEKNQKFPADILDADGKPLLSWRVDLLQTMGAEGLDLYNKFKLDEPWDSEANKNLLEEMPIIFHPLTTDVAPPQTVVRFFNSAGTPLSNRNLKIEDLQSPETTLLLAIVTPQYAVEWTKPDSLEFNKEKIAEILGNSPLGVTFLGRPCLMPLLPNMDTEQWKRDIETLIYGAPQPEPQPEPQSEPQSEPQPEVSNSNE